MLKILKYKNQTINKMNATTDLLRPQSPSDLEMIETMDLAQADISMTLESMDRTLESDPYDTFFNGIMVNIETYGIFGYHIYNRHDIRVYGNDNIFITSEPRNIAPLEFLTIYRSNGVPLVSVFDWGLKKYAKFTELTEQFSKTFGRLMQTPNGEKVYAFCFQNFFNFQRNSNQVILCDAQNKWHLFYESPVTGIPAPAPQGVASGWSVFEYKRFKAASEPWANVPFMLGTIGLQVMDKNGKWFTLSGQQSGLREDSPQYQRVFVEPHISSAYRS